MLCQDIQAYHSQSINAEETKGQHIEPQSIIKPNPGTIEQYLANYIRSNYHIKYPEELIAQSLMKQVHTFNNARNNIKRAYKERDC